MKALGLRLKILSFLIIFFGGLTACDSSLPPENTQEAINIGRLICGGHLPLAIVENKYQHELKTFQLKTVQNHDWNDVVRDMNNGELAGTFILSPLAMKLIHDGFSGKIVLKADRNGNGFVLSKNIKSIKQLNKQKSIIAVPHIFSQHHVLLTMVMQQHGIDKDNVIILGMPPRDMIASLKNGEIDGFVVGEPEGNKAISLGIGWMAAISPEIWKDHMDHVFMVSDQFINQKPEELQELINYLIKSGQYIESHPHEAAVMGVNYTGSAAEVFEKVLTDPPDWIDYSDMVPTQKDISSMAEKMVNMKLWKKVPDDLGRYIDLRFVEKASQKIFHKK